MIPLIASQITEGKSQRRDPDATPTLIRDVLVWPFFRSRVLLLSRALVVWARLLEASAPEAPAHQQHCCVRKYNDTK